MKKLTLILTGSLLGAAMLLPATTTTPATLTPLEEKVRHELVVLPFYNVFDNLAFRVNGNEVTLTGHVTRPTLKSSAENVVKRLEGVARVNNQIEVLPLSPFDDRLRVALFRTIYSQPGLDKYALGAVPGIHIIVNNGNVTLEGVVLNEMDRNIAFLKANGVPGVFNVQNNLRLETRTK
ncbi:MAG: BON domain-containing protein [Acidobacteria bacterium]|nr:BON domain-containing protein [Acidobacteriota bacterium]